MMPGLLVSLSVSCITSEAAYKCNFFVPLILKRGPVPIKILDFILVIAGSGLLIEQLKQLAGRELNKRIFFTGLLAPQQLRQLTKTAWCGFSLDKPVNINQQASLPNKLFDYIAAGVPVVTSNITEVAAIIHEFKIGKIIDTVTPETIAAAVNSLATENELYHQYKSNTTAAAKQLSWDSEKIILQNLFIKVATENNIAIG